MHLKTSPSHFLASVWSREENSLSSSKTMQQIWPHKVPLPDRAVALSCDSFVILVFYLTLLHIPIHRLLKMTWWSPWGKWEIAQDLTLGEKSEIHNCKLQIMIGLWLDYDSVQNKSVIHSNYNGGTVPSSYGELRHTNSWVGKKYNRTFT